MDIGKLQDFNSNYVGDYPLLRKLAEDWAERKPLRGLRLLHNIPITRETMLKLEPLYLSGADVTVTHLRLPGLEPKQECVDLLKAAGAHMELDHAKLYGDYDIALDCCAQIPAMERVTVRRGFVELTQSGSPVYSKLDTDLPIYSLDLSRLKCLEAMFGTGEAFVRAFRQFVEPRIEGRKFVLFGYGKVGRGVSRYLAQEGAMLTVVDTNGANLEQARKAGFDTELSRPGPSLLNAVNDSFVVVMATGCEGLLQELIKPKQLADKVLLINMGADDEFGDRYAASRIVANKAPLNFLLDAPTTMFFIDPIFAVHNQCCEHVLDGNAHGFSPLPPELDLPVIEEWSTLYGIDISDIYY
ncbi:NAD-binding protein [Hoeflea prorocentri]|uniref:NAD-binding protein n=1 Tax=Hoeflea prorocentri TaxID=1922333 RepID=A0A9X3ZH83_9HYPH|nr:NAD-binding protein [Hoeflea prorocentri]MCY6381029.1 NAD-binding protein [Hoeflea prorocentri]MDA5398829.1 NAD-binding protein [Hoeflea prorocentri]